MASMTPPHVLTLLLFLHWTGDVNPLDACTIDCSNFWTLGDRADDPVNCHMYYICFDPNTHSDFSFNCPEGQFFDTVTKKCMTSGYTCSPECEKCTFSCGTAILGKAANRIDCSSYFTCGTSIVPHVCPSTKKYFDGYECQASESKCCSCKAECSATDATYHNFVPDYRNCTNYYLCLSQGIPDETSHGHCPSGNFDEMNRECSDTAPCLEPCAHLPYNLKNLTP